MAQFVGTGDAPLWQQVLDDLDRRLAAGEFHERFPTDRELVEHYEVSRHTVREAVRHLKARGVIQRQRGRGSVVRDQTLAQPMGTLYSLFRAVEEAGMTQGSEVLSLGPASDQRAADRFDVDPDDDLVRLERIRYADDEPIALDTVWLPGDVGRTILDVDFSHTALYDELERHAGLRIERGEETVAAVAADDDVRDVLQLEDDEGVLRIERHGWVGDRLVECRVTLARGSRFQLVSTWPQTTPTSASVKVRDDG